MIFSYELFAAHNRDCKLILAGVTEQCMQEMRKNNF